MQKNTNSTRVIPSTTIIDLGYVLEGKVLPFEFTYTGDIVNIQTSCGCTKPTYNNATKKVKGTIKTDAISKYPALVKQGKGFALKPYTITLIGKGSDTVVNEKGVKVPNPDYKTVVYLRYRLILDVEKYNKYTELVKIFG